MIRGAFGRVRTHDLGMANGDLAAVEGLVEGGDRKERGKGAEARRRGGGLQKLLLEEVHLGQHIAPIIEVARNERGQVSRLAKEGVLQQMVYLPEAFLARQPQV